MWEVGRRFWGISYRKINSSAAGNITQDLRFVGAKLKHLRSGRKSQKFDYRNHKTCKMIAAWIPGLQLTQIIPGYHRFQHLTPMHGRSNTAHCINQNMYNCRKGEKTHCIYVYVIQLTSHWGFSVADHINCYAYF